MDWLDELYRLVASSQDCALDLVLEKIDDLLLEGRFEVVNEILSTVDVQRLDPTVMLALLSVTKSTNQNLPCWQKLFVRVESELVERFPGRAQKLLLGLR